VRFNPNVRLDPTQVDFIAGISQAGAHPGGRPAGIPAYMTPEDQAAFIQNVLPTAMHDIMDILRGLL
jgi:hypothetical protein